MLDTKTRLPHYVSRKLALLLVLLLTCQLFLATEATQVQAADTPAPVPGGFSDPAINALWYRSDLPVITGVTARSLVWGGDVLRKWQEPYKESKGGSRIVVYFDKARMEINNPDGDRNSQFYITNGLLVRELISGKVQLGDDTYELREPASNVTIAGDPIEGNADAPTYATLNSIASLNNDNPAAQRTGATVTTTLDKNGGTGESTTLADYAVKYQDFDGVLNHNVPDVFVKFFGIEGPVYDITKNANSTGKIFDAFTAVGRPLTEAYWTKAKVSGVERDVLLQAFERRVLTYTPSNPAGFQVEVGNVGVHYYRWRYKLDPFTFQNKEVGANGAIVAVANPYAAQAGADILNKGGNAIDAAAGIMFTLGLVEPQSSGIGGGGFMTIRTKTGETVTVDTREKAPAGATPDMFLGPDGKELPFNTAVLSGKSVGVPGAVAGAELAVTKYGKLKLADVLAPATDLAQKGFVVTPRFIEALNDPASADKLKNTPEGYAFFFPGGKALTPGTLLKNEDLAKTYQLIAKDGAKAFYEGPLAEAIAKAVQAKGGSMTTADLKNYNVRTDTPISATYRGYDIISNAPPSSGGLTMMQILKILEGYDLKSYGQNSANYLHLLTEATRLAFADRGKYLGDDEFVKIPLKGYLNPSYIDSRRALISLDKALNPVTAGDPTVYESPIGGFKDYPVGKNQVDGRETSHFVVADAEGNVVTFTNTVESGYGSGIFVPGYGFLLNNELTDFNFTPGGANEVQPNKRPRSSMNPTMVLKDGKPVLVLGSPGGSSIILSITQVLINVVDFGMPLQEAIDAPRTFGSAYPTISWEVGISQAVRDDLAKRGHTIATNPAFIGSVQAVYFKPDGSKTGGADWRRDGTVIGIK